MEFRRALNQRGVALVMVLSFVAVLAVLVSEFTYISQVNQKMAYDRVHQIQAHYLAKSALKISLLRLKAYQSIKSLVGNQGGGLPGVPKEMLDQIWNFPLIWPVPTEIPGLPSSTKEMIEKFQKDSNLPGNFTASIDSESSKYNINLLFQRFVPKKEDKKNDNKKKNTPKTGKNNTSKKNPDDEEKENPDEGFNTELARQALRDYLQRILSNKFETDEEFAEEYRDFNLETLVEEIFLWADSSYKTQNAIPESKIEIKKAPFYSLSELHMLPSMDEKLYQLFAPGLTASTTSGINVNTIDKTTLRAIIPQMTVEEVDAFMEFRNSEEENNRFNKADDFFAYLKKEVNYFLGDDQELNQLKEDLSKKNIQIVTDESVFKINIRAQVEQATRVIEADVILRDPSSTSKADSKNTQNSPNTTDPPKAKTDPGLQLVFMRIL